jgi:hypothetical protein
MEIKPCKDCLYYDDCIKNNLSYDFPDKLKNRLYYMFVEGWDCFIKKRKASE